jgi:hypothetical protein
MAGRGGKDAKRKAQPSDAPDPNEDAMPDAQTDAQPEAPLDTPSARKTGARRKTRQGAFPLIALALAVALVGIGVASYFAASLLGNAVRAAERRGAETPAALAATVCGDLIHQNYGDLVARVDPNAAPPAATGPFDASATAQRLHTLDQADGPVISCSASPLAASEITPPAGPDGATRLLLTVWRAGTPRPIAAVLITRLSPNGAWVIERDSSFLRAT